MQKPNEPAPILLSGRHRNGIDYMTMLPSSIQITFDENGFLGADRLQQLQQQRKRNAEMVNGLLKDFEPVSDLEAAG